MIALASQITSLTVVYTSVYPGADQSKHQSSALLAFVRGIHRWPVNSPHKGLVTGSPHKGPVTLKMFPFDDVIMIAIKSCLQDWTNIPGAYDHPIASSIHWDQLLGHIHGYEFIQFDEQKGVVWSSVSKRVLYGVRWTKGGCVEFGDQKEVVWSSTHLFVSKLG